jgi:hypothetical protein
LTGNESRDDEERKRRKKEEIGIFLNITVVKCVKFEFSKYPLKLIKK